MGPLTTTTIKKFEFHKSKMADGGLFENGKIAISLQPSDRFWRNLSQWRTLAPYSGYTVTISNFWKSKMASTAILKNHKNRDISATVWPIFTKFDMLVQNGSLNKTANINTKNCSLSNVLTATDQKLQKSLKRSYYSASRWHSGDVMVRNNFLMIFAGFFIRRR